MMHQWSSLPFQVLREQAAFTDLVCNISYKIMYTYTHPNLISILKKEWKADDEKTFSRVYKHVVTPVYTLFATELDF